MGIFGSKPATDQNCKDEYPTQCGLDCTCDELDCTCDYRFKDAYTARAWATLKADRPDMYDLTSLGLSDSGEYTLDGNPTCVGGGLYDGECDFTQFVCTLRDINGDLTRHDTSQKQLQTVYEAQSNGGIHPQCPRVVEGFQFNDRTSTIIKSLFVICIAFSLIFQLVGTPRGTKIYR